MKLIQLFIVLVLVAFSSNALSYGGGGGKGGAKACKKPKFSNFNPVHLSAVAPESEFSFTASATTSPSTLEVTVKKMSVNVNIKKTKTGYQVTGKLPASLKSTFARVNIKAKTTSKCVGSDGWLVKIEG